MNVIKKHSRRIISLWVLSVMAMPIALFSIFTRFANATEITSKSVSISSAIPSASITQNFSFNIPSSSPLGSIQFLYCDNSPLEQLPCTAPPGLDVSGASLTSQTLNTGFSLDGSGTNANTILLTRPVAAGVSGQSTYNFSSIINPSDVNKTVYIRISTFATVDGTGPKTDQGSLAFATSQPGFSVGLFVPPFLTFCVGATVAKNCSSTSSSLASFGEFSENNVSTTTTQMSVATNDPGGYNIFLNGFTLTSGNKTIDAMATLASSQVGTSQFGMNLRSNSSPSVGAEPDGGVGIGAPATGYNTANQFKFVSGDKVASASGSSDFTLYTVSYIANVKKQQPPGLYATTLTYTAVATF
ncbi:hypothetical protein KC960_03920 [Candidatus Saccharibacteria bacterium]|nr:hypothetical protein [Candidatus Saccharibacteria bacterium]